MSNSNRKQALGKGLSALLSSSAIKAQARPAAPAITAASPAVPAPPQAEDSASKPVRYIPLADIQPNPRQPRARFDQEKLQELSASITNHGVLQPVLVVPQRSSGKFTLLAGERRLRAAELAGLKEIPALVTEATDEEMLEIALVENVQRDDLNPVEEARAYKALTDSFGWSQEVIAQRVGKNRSTVANALRLLKLAPEALRDLESGRLTAGHARAILAVPDESLRKRLHEEIVSQGISVREAEQRATKYQQPRTGTLPVNAGKKSNSNGAEVLDTVALQERLMEHLGCRVRIRSRDGKSGVLEIPFGDPTELQRFLDVVDFSFT